MMALMAKALDPEESDRCRLRRGSPSVVEVTRQIQESWLSQYVSAHPRKIELFWMHDKAHYRVSCGILTK
jgi:hypothetical protein